MADNSNKFSVSGLPRNRKLSGLHAHRSENIPMYFDYTQIKVAPQFVSIMQAKVTSVGTNYSKNTTLAFPQPQHPSGVAASGYPLFSLAKSSFSVNSGGSNYSIGETFPILHNTFLVGTFSVVATGTSGSISDYSVFSVSLDLKDGTVPVLDLSLNPTASISLNDKYTISSALLTYPGYGYQTLDRTQGTSIDHSPTISNAGTGSPSGLVIKSSLDPYVLQETTEDQRIKSPETNRFEEVMLDRNKSRYFIVNNFSLGDFPHPEASNLSVFYSPNSKWTSVNFSGNGSVPSPFVKASIVAGSSDGMSIKVTSTGFIKIAATAVRSNAIINITLSGTNSSTTAISFGSFSGYSGSINSVIEVLAGDTITFGSSGANISYTNLSIFYSKTIIN